MSGDWKRMIRGVQEGDYNLVLHYIKEGVDVNHEHPEVVTTALIESVLHSDFAIAQLLIKHGADPHLKGGFENHSPITVARQRKDKKMLSILRSQLPEHKSFIQKVVLKLWG